MTTRTLAILTLGLLLTVGCRNTPDTPKDDTGPTTQDADGDGWEDEDDCEPDDPAINPDAEEVCDDVDNDCDGEIDEDAADAGTWYYDADEDGFGDPESSITACEQPDGTTDVDAAIDCDDTRDDVSPDADEVCDEIDNDCDGEVDEDATDATTWYTDADDDGYGDPDAEELACEQPAGTTDAEGATDCDDDNAETHPAADEICDGIDNDCDELVDDDDLVTDATSWFLDADGDGWADPRTTTTACEPPSGFIAAKYASDCDDDDASINPDATEICDGIDNDCDGLTDDDDDSVTGTSSWYADGDGDGYGDASTTSDACEAPSGYIADDTDCDDSDADISPAGTETCDGIDNDCDGLVDDDDSPVTGTTTWYLDSDGDGWGDPRTTTSTCDQPSGWVGGTLASDCDDTDATISPDATEICDGIDNDCDGLVDDDDSPVTGTSTWYLDSDGDGWADPRTTTTACDAPSGFLEASYATDCDDSDSAINPDATETCDGIDNDCDGLVDDDDSPVTGTSTWYLDSDGDGWADARTTTTACDAPSGFLEGAYASDCDDSDATINPDATEVCDSVDNDCDGDVDEDDASDASTWYADSDGDGYGDAASTTTACDEPTGYSSDATDCDDSDSAINPGATETWYDGVDSDCDGASDYDADGDGDDAEDHGGTDCDDSDATRYGGVDCRPTTTVTHADAATLTSSAPNCAIDLYIDADGVAYVSTVISGTDYVYVIDASGGTTVLTGYSNYNMNGVCTDPSTNLVVVGYNSYNGFGYQSGSSLPYVARGTASYGSLWTNSFANYGPSSLAMDTAGCIWFSKWAGAGDVSCVDTAGSATTMATMSDRVESVALDADEELYVTVDDEVWYVDTSAGTTTLEYTADADILDMVFDYNGDLYIETTADEIELLPGDGSSASVFDSVSGDGKLAISPEGWLVRMELGTYSAHCAGSATFTEWELE